MQSAERMQERALVLLRGRGPNSVGSGEAFGLSGWVVGGWNV